jgi:hypothetical protein
MATTRRPLLGHLLVTEGLVTKAQLRDALRAQAAPPHPRFEQVLVDRGVLSQSQLDALLATYQRKLRLGPLLLDAKILTESQLQRALEHQRRTGRRLGDALIALNLVSERQMKEAVCRQFGFRFVDLDRVAVDGSLVALLEKADARRHRVLPVARADERLTVAVDDPTDIDYLDVLAEASGCEIDVVTSTSAAFWRAFARVYGTGTDSLGVLLAPGAPVELDPAGPAFRGAEARQAATARALAEQRAGREASGAARGHADPPRAPADGATLDARSAEALEAPSTLVALRRAVTRLSRVTPAALLPRPRARPEAGEAVSPLAAPPEPSTTPALGEVPAPPAAPPADEAPESVPRAPAPEARSLPGLRQRHAEIRQVLAAAQEALVRQLETEERDAGPATAAALADLQAASEALRAERDAGARAFAELEARHAAATRALAELRAAHDRLLQDRAGDTGLREAAQRAGAELEAAQDALALEREAGAWARQELSALRRRHETLGRELDAALRALGDVRRRGGVGQSPDR